jgi:aldose 1-epimerase
VHKAITQAPFGTLPGGAEVSEFTLANSRGMVVKILDFGGVVRELHVLDRDGRYADVVLGFDTLAPYLEDSPYFGALIGRYGNRIAKGRFKLGGQTWQLARNDGGNHLHGGAPGFDKVLWAASIDGASLVLRYRSPDGEQGYPGNLDATVRYSLSEENELVVRFEATSDQPTPVNLTQHSYFNLRGAAADPAQEESDILQHEILIDADRFLPIDAGSIPLGPQVAVTGTPFDFRQPRPIGERIGQPDKQLRHGSGYDHCWVLNRGAGERGLRRAVRVREPQSGRVLELITEEPGVQFYSGNFLDGTLTGKGGRRYAHRSGFCIEPQHFPDSPNQPAYPDTILRPGAVYATESRFIFSVEP